MDSCRNFQALNAWQLERLKKLFADEKWLGSERAGYDIGMEKTQMELFESGLYNRRADELRKEYCGTICRYSWSCWVWGEMKRKGD